MTFRFSAWPPEFMRHAPFLFSVCLVGICTLPLWSKGADLVDLARTARPSVVRDADKLVAETMDGRQIPILGMLAKDQTNDIAILEANFIPESGKTGNTPILPGERIFVIGAPIGLSGTLSEGMVSALRTSRDIEKFSSRKSADRENLLQITAAISPGSSGSPVINVNGEVVGVAVSFLTGGQSLNFAMPAAVVQKLLAEISAGTAPVAFRKKNLGMNAAISAVFFLAIFVGYKFFTRR